MWFTYPGAEAEVFRGLDLELDIGRSIGIVGPNGVGKTTLVKLLSRLYDPDQGEILVDGIPLSTLEPEAWRRNIAVIFQDFVRYELTAAENIGVGCIDRPDSPAMIAAAAEKAGVASVLARGYTHGTDLSGGQWQRVALARGFAAVEAGARLLVLDEPTANLDVDAEAAFFDRFLDLTKGLTTIPITHRMSSVRHVDKICVVDGGRVAESGTHSELLSAGGLFARMFELQARQFRRGDGE